MVLCDDLEGWDGGGVEGRLKRKGIYVYLQLIHFVRQKLTQHCKVIIPQFYKASWKENQQVSVTDETEPFMTIQSL